MRGREEQRVIKTLNEMRMRIYGSSCVLAYLRWPFYSTLHGTLGHVRPKTAWHSENNIETFLYMFSGIGSK